MAPNPPADPFAVTGRKKVELSPLHAPVRRLVFAAAAGSVAAWLVQTLFGTGGFLPVAAAAFALLVGWAAAVRLLFLEMKGRGFWGVWLAAGAVMAFAARAGSDLWIAGASFSGIFLLARRFRPFSHLGHRSRSRVFFAALAAWSALTWGWLIGGKPSFAAAGAAAAYLLNPLRYAWIGLQAFWTLALLHLFFKARLHAVRIRPKLAVSTFLIVAVPMVWLLVMSGVVLISAMGELQAARAGTLVRDWTRLSFDVPEAARAFSGAWFTAADSGGGPASGAPPPAWPDLVATAAKPEASLAVASAAKAEGGVFVRLGSELWGIRRDASGRLTGGFRVDARFLNRLAGVVHADIELSMEDPFRSSRTRGSDAAPPSDEGRAGGTDLKPDVRGAFGPAASASGRWRIGMTHLDFLDLRDGRLAPARALLSIRSTPGLLLDELYSESNPVSRILLVAVIILGAVLLSLEAFVLVFGIRIAGGITSAVRALHRGARRIAAGDLDTPIEIANEDELGDLAAAVNEMAAAVKRGRAEADRRAALEGELAVARGIQERLLPHVMPAVPGFEISGTSIPSQQVGGDYFDFLDLEDGRLGIAIADVSGKGIPAALLMANLQAVLRGQAEERGDAAAVLARVNNYLVRSTDPHMFATFFYGILDRTKACFVSSSAGHNPPLLLRADGTLQRLSAGGLILGFLANQAYAQESVDLGPGDVLVLFTDGITEASSPGPSDRPDRFFGEDALIRVVRESAGRTAGEIQTAILNAVAAHTAGAPQGDDVTLVVVKRRGVS